MVRARTSCVITVPRSNHGNSGRRSFVANSDHPYHSYSPYTKPCERRVPPPSSLSSLASLFFLFV